MNKHKRRGNPIRILLLVVLIGVGIYLNQVVIADVPPLFISTPTATRAPESFVTDAQTLENEGKISQAIEAYKQAILADSMNTGNYISLARLLIYLNRYDEALEQASNALLINENNAMAYALRGWAQGLSGDYLNGTASLKRAIELDPNNHIPYAYIAEVYGLQYESNTAIIGVIDNAISNSIKARDLSPNSLETHRARGYIQELVGSYGEAVQEYAAAIAINKYIPELYMRLGRVYYYPDVAEYDLAVQAFTEADLLNPSDPLPDIYLSKVYQTQGSYATAIQYAEKAIVDDPEDPYLYGNLGVLYYRNYEYPNAIEMLRLVIRGGTSESGVTVEPLPLDYGTISQYYQIYGLSLARVDECTEALQISEALLKNVGGDEITVYNAGEIVNICAGISEEE
ncbi:MAG: tetratricopeptide repeat protein [Anaerolineaceae bacterium]|jgi:tetratricopeptide (TPR) repeat protein|nr:tetratricopeptide repeat protein [Anaerolineaceae bacterium]